MVDKITLDNSAEDFSKKRLILNKIQEQIYGINISKIAKALNMHRITVTNYVEELEKENRITVQKIGQSRICFMKSKDISSNNYQSTVLDIFQYFFESFEEVIPSHLVDTEKVMKEIGKAMNKRLKFPKFKNKQEIDLTNKREALDKIADIGLSLLKVLNDLLRIQSNEDFVQAKKANFIEGDDEIAITLKIQFAPLNYLDFQSLYHVVAGSIEDVLQENFGETVNFDVHMIPPEKFVCYYKISIK